MKTGWIAYAVAGLLIVMLALVQSNAPKPLNWNPTYSSSDKIPLGTYILRERLEDIFPAEGIRDQEAPFINYLEYEDPANLLLINRSLELTETDNRLLRDFAFRGGHVFLSSEVFSEEYLLDHFGLSLFQGFSVELDSMRDLTLVNPAFTQDTFEIADLNTNAYFITDENFSGQILGLNGAGKPNFIRCTFGEGEILLHSDPVAFSNHTMISGDNYRYAFSALSYLPAGPLIWDEYYKLAKQYGSPLRYILTSPALRTAWYILLLGILLYFLVQSKRLQRAIPVIAPLENSSLEFTKNIGRLYYRSRNNKALAMKKIKHWHHDLRERFHVSERHPDFEELLIQRSGLRRKLVKDLVRITERVSQLDRVENDTLMQLDAALYEYKRQVNGSK